MTDERIEPAETDHPHADQPNLDHPPLEGGATNQWKEPPGFGPLLWVGCILGPLVFFALIAGGLLASGQSLETAVGLGLFIAAWGGLGLGAMAAGVVYLSRLEVEEELAAATRHLTAPAKH